MRKSHKSTAPNRRPNEAESGRGDPGKILAHESPQRDVNGDPNEFRRAGWVVFNEVNLAKKYCVDSFYFHAGYSDSNMSGSRAMAMKSSSRSFLPCSRGSVFGSPSSRILPCERNRIRSQTSVTSCILCDVHRTPPVSLAA